ncbi:histone deacetylase family protein [Thalassoglobus polymorphus]|uniref:Histone deacetylase-like amidohydrolase n=1 Tax=Thalassoglobus polymorphus TaxID=2527994 RepID=A0A517QMZ6_9PLAN|nr:histone deacetylase [Thalassoglobus polymorphus]QDT33020.1 Histone deacetylase-like amidohydrolase [Thalassoglobus polymorphus]
MPSLLYMDDCFLNHGSESHPECPARLRHLSAHLQSTDLIQQFERQQIIPATEEQLQLAHHGGYIHQLKKFAEAGGGWIENDTFVSQQSFETARAAVGTVIEAVDAVMKGVGRQAVCLVRPPGHHALPTMAMGFCLFNNIAIGAIHAREHHLLHRILIVDWDVHHGNGTQHLFYRDHDVYYLSVHRSPLFPGTGTASETGEGDGLGTTFNLPLEFGVSRKEYFERFSTLLDHAASRCRPELVLLSAGFDAHHADPIGSLGLETEDYAPLTKMVQDVANEYCDGRLISVLEGGYNVPVLADCVELHLRTLLDHTP